MLLSVTDCAIRVSDSKSESVGASGRDSSCSLEAFLWTWRALPWDDLEDSNKLFNGYLTWTISMSDFLTSLKNKQLDRR